MNEIAARVVDAAREAAELSLKPGVISVHGSFGMAEAHVRPEWMAENLGPIAVEEWQPHGARSECVRRNVDGVIFIALELTEEE